MTSRFQFDADLQAKVSALLADVSAKRTCSFTGTGIVFYYSLDELPHLQMTSEENASYPLDTVDIQAMGKTLCAIADASSQWHDGFHFVSADSWQLTHVSQFVAPPIGSSGKPILGSGARYVTALLSSQVEGIAYVGLVGRQGDALLFRKGEVITEVSLG